MGKHEKLLAKLQNRPKDFTFQEVTTLLAGFGYALNQSGSGSRVKFEHEQYASIYMHKPHPLPVLKPYQLDVVIDTLKQEGLL
ncbi:MAG: type II toxin-antitoxin system HicA family toxin [Gallionellaceae bacterium]|nr:type II toxin-antitoxin system HicA family toxin [Gallionellaceae bacterium]